MIAPQILINEQGSFILSTVLATWVTLWSPQYWKLFKKLFKLFSSRPNSLAQVSPTINRADADEDHITNFLGQNIEQRDTSGIRYKIYEGFEGVFGTRTAEEGLFHAFGKCRVLSGTSTLRTREEGSHTGRESSIESLPNASIWHKLIMLILLAFCAAIFSGTYYSSFHLRWLLSSGQQRYIRKVRV